MGKNLHKNPVIKICNYYKKDIQTELCQNRLYNQSDTEDMPRYLRSRHELMGTRRDKLHLINIYPEDKKYNYFTPFRYS